MRTLLLFFLLTISFGSLAQMTVDYPYNNQILQRNASNEAIVSFLGKVSKEATTVEYQLIPVVNGKEQSATNWKVLDSNAIGGFYQGKLAVKGGLYTCKVRSKNQTSVLDSAVLKRFGVGEVFIIAGQSNAQGVERELSISGTDNEMVIAANFSNVFQPANGETFTYIGRDNLNFPNDKFEVLKNTSIIGPVGMSNSFWPKLGDQIANSLHIPVCFFNVAWGGTSIRNWAESSRGIASKNPWADLYYEKGFPFENLKQVIKSFANINGIRAVLWQIGETDTDKLMPKDDFVNYFKEVQQAIVNFTGVNVPMVVAQGTYFAREFNGSCVPTNNYTGIIDGIKSLWNLPNETFVPGPNTDVIEIPRLTTVPEGCVHFSKNSFNQLAENWFEKLNSLIASSNKYFTPISLPTLEKVCGENNANNLILPSNQFNLLVDNKIVSTDSSQVYKNLVGLKFKLTNKEGAKISFVSPEYHLESFPEVTPPVITAKGLTSICADSKLEIESNFSQVLWNTGILTKTITVNTTGNYFATVKNKYNCFSKPSNVVNLKVFENPSLPIISQLSPYFLYGGVKLFDTDFNWQLGDKLLNKSDVYLKVNQSGTYKMFSSKKYSSELTCKSPLAEFTYTLPDDAGLTAYPNPLFDNSFVTVESISDLLQAKYTLVDELGKMVKEGTISTNDSFKLDVSGLATGKYVLLISTQDQKSYTKRLIVGK